VLSFDKIGRIADFERRNEAKPGPKGRVPRMARVILVPSGFDLQTNLACQILNV